VYPTSGTVRTNGRIVALLELGSGFNLEFTGRENVYLNGAMYGLSKQEMESKFGEIAGFADIGEFIDRPVKTYSSGMFARLAFSVAINLDPEILIVDEILAVGDIAFQAKCVAKLRKMKDAGLTLLFVSHSVDAIKSLCNEAILLENGKLVQAGTSEQITNLYLAKVRKDMNAQQSDDQQLSEAPSPEQQTVAFEKAFTYGDGDVFFQSIDVFNEQGEKTIAFGYGESATLQCVISSKKAVNNVNVSFLVRDITGIDLFGTTMFDEKIPLVTLREGEKKAIAFSFPITLRPGSYSVSVAVNTVSQKDYSDVFLHQQIDAAAAFEVVRNPDRPIHYKFYVPVEIS